MSGRGDRGPNKTFTRGSGEGIEDFLDLEYACGERVLLNK